MILYVGYIKPFPAIHYLSSAYKRTLVAYFTNNMDPDQTATKGAI